MRPALVGLVAAALALGCSGGGREVVVTRDQFQQDWPLTVNSAVVICRDGSDVVLLKLGPRRYGLSEAARAAGHPGPPTLRGADPASLRSVCAPEVATRP
jgi:hypothetical protein